jgi:hypothetical protein
MDTPDIEALLSEDETVLAHFDVFVASIPFRKAKTAIRNPHEYNVCDPSDPPTVREPWIAAVITIRKFGKTVMFWKKSYTVLDRNGYRYWTMGNSLAVTKIFNRRPLTDKDRA